MSDRSNISAGAGPGVMLLSAAIFGYFGFTMVWNYTGVNGEFLLFVALLDWTLKIASIGFLAAALITFLRSVLGNFIYCVISLLSAISFLVVAVLDLMDDQHTAIHPFLLFVFAAWNGYGAWAGLKEVMSTRDETAPGRTFAPPSSHAP